MMLPAAILALLVLPPLVLRGWTLVRWYATAATLILFAWILRQRLPELDPHLGAITLAVLLVAMLALFIAKGSNVRFSAGRAALLAGVVYAFAIPPGLVIKPDGDEPFYLLMTESLVHDGDLDLANQYAAIDRTASGRTDLVPQFGDPKGRHGEQYSRHEPFLPLLMIPGYLLGGLQGAIATIALFGMLLVRSTIRWMEEEGIGDHAIRAVYPFFAFAPPVLFYATRIWPEVPAAFFFVEALRGVRAHRSKRWVPALLGFVLLKLRFVLVTIGLVLAERRAFTSGRSRRSLLLTLGILILPLAVMYLVTRDPDSVHSWRELLPASPERYVRGFFGTLTDAMSGIPFQAPFYLFGLFAILRWKETPRGFRIGILASLLYLFYLLPRPEWFGGWAPPLRYLVFVMPVLALGAAAMWERLSRGAIAIAAAWTVALVIHGLRWPHRLFHLFNGENAVGEWFSTLYHSDFSRLFPSFIRANEARWIGVGVVLLLLTVGLRRTRLDLAIPLFSLALAAGFVYGRQPAARIELEDAHVLRDGGRLYPEQWTIMRTEYRGGWVLEGGESISFLAQKGTWTLHYITGLGALIEVAGQAVQLPAGERYQTARITIPASGRVTLRCLSGAVNADSLERHD